VIVGAGLGIAALAGAAVYVPRSAASSGTRTTAASTAANDFQFEQLTSSGNASQPAISPDGRYVAYIQRDATQYSLWIRQTATPGNVQIVAPEPGRLLLTPTITPDGNFADFITGPFPQTELRRIPFLGGPQRTILERVHRPIGWSPDGKRFGFLRMNDARVRGRRGAALVVAAYDGSGERIVAYREDFARRQLAAVEVLVGLAIAAQRRPLERDSREEPARP
jgi:dipeptidyl aminopeptidase/acylaminoacyl peptidase